MQTLDDVSTFVTLVREAQRPWRHFSTAIGDMLYPNFDAAPDYKLYVDDGIITEKLKVAVKGTPYWADYVFEDSYKLRPLSEVEAFIKENKHLPDIPSAETVVEEGIDVAAMDAKLLQKIEELTLYVIETAKENERLRKDVETLKATVASSEQDR